MRQRHDRYTAHPDRAAALAGVFESQIAGGKRYDLAMDGRRAANAVFRAATSSERDSRRVTTRP